MKSNFNYILHLELENQNNEQQDEKSGDEM